MLRPTYCKFATNMCSQNTLYTHKYVNLTRACIVLNISNKYHLFTLELEFMRPRITQGWYQCLLSTLAFKYHSSISENTQSHPDHQQAVGYMSETARTHTIIS